MLNLHAIVPCSRANGPGQRMVIWLQGCTLGCPVCFNPATHAHEPRWLVSAEELLERILVAEPNIEGLTVSGGEPLQQLEALLQLLASVRVRTNLSIILFSGYSMTEIKQMALGPDILAQVDVLIAGRYVHTRRLARGLLGSANQTVHLLTQRYNLEDIEHVPVAEIWIGADGTTSGSGIDPIHR